VVDTQQAVGIAQIVVGDTQTAMEKAAHEWRKPFTIPIVGVAGSNGKTTVKEMTAGFSRRRATASPRAAI